VKFVANEENKSAFSKKLLENSNLGNFQVCKAANYSNTGPILIKKSQPMDGGC